MARRLLPAAVLVLAALTGCAEHTHVTRTGELQPQVQPVDAPSPGVQGQNRTLARAELARLRAAFPIPPGAKRVMSPPTRRMRHLGAYTEPVDGTLVRPRWWIVPMPYRDLVRWYVAHTPANIGSTYTVDSDSPVPESELYWSVSHQTSAYSKPAEVTAYARLGPRRTALRTDVTLAARYDRTADTIVPPTVTRVDVTYHAIDGPDGGKDMTATVTDPASLQAIVAAFDGLPGAYAHVTGLPCGSPVGIQYAYDVTFRWPGHALESGAGAQLCGIGRPLTLDGAELPQSLEDTDDFDEVVQGAL